MKVIVCLKIFTCASLLVGCATTFPPPELIDARQACSHASGTPSSQLAPAEMRKAREALASAEQSFLDDPHSDRTRSLAALAIRLAKHVEALGKTVSDSVIAARADREYEVVRTQTTKNINEALAASRQGGNPNGVKPVAEPDNRLGASKHAADARADLANLAVVTEEDRGLVITLPGDVLFAMNRSTLMASPRHRLEQVADVLMANRERKLTVESHTDSRGSSRQNQELSQQRADAVRSFIVSRGYPGDLIVAQGIGNKRPVADNSSAKGRAKNRRVEIVVNNAAKP